MVGRYFCEESATPVNFPTAESIRRSSAVFCRADPQDQQANKEITTVTAMTDNRADGVLRFIVRGLLTNIHQFFVMCLPGNVPINWVGSAVATVLGPGCDAPLCGIAERGLHFLPQIRNFKDCKSNP